MSKRGRQNDDGKEDWYCYEDGKGRVDQGVVSDTLSSDALSPELIEAELIRIGMIHKDLEYIREEQFSRDPMLTILYDPEKEIEIPSPTDPTVLVKTTVIDELLRSAHEACKRNYGQLYEEFDLIQGTMTDLLASKDTHAKQVTFLCMLATERSLQTQLEMHYPRDGGPEIHRLLPFLAVIRAEMDGMLNTAYVNVPVPTPYNVDNLIVVFLAKLSDAYRA